MRRSESRKLLAWAVERWEAEVKHRPLQNIYRRCMDSIWRQTIRRLGGDDAALCGPPHDDLLAMEREHVTAARIEREELREADFQAGRI